MSKKKKSNNTGKRSGGSIFKDERFKFTVGLIITCFSILIFLSLISYLFTWKIDQSFECNKVFSGPDVRVHNWAGKTGACFAKLLIYKCFG